MHWMGIKGGNIFLRLISPTNGRCVVKICSLLLEYAWWNPSLGQFSLVRQIANTVQFGLVELSKRSVKFGAVFIVNWIMNMPTKKRENNMQDIVYPKTIKVERKDSWLLHLPLQRLSCHFHLEKIDPHIVIIISDTSETSEEHGL